MMTGTCQYGSSTLDISSDARRAANLRILALLDILHPVAQENLPINVRLPRQVQALVREEAGALRDRRLQFNEVDVAQAAQRVRFSGASRVLNQLVVVLLTIRDSSQRDRGAGFLGRGNNLKTTYDAMREYAPSLRRGRGPRGCLRSRPGARQQRTRRHSLPSYNERRR